MKLIKDEIESHIKKWDVEYIYFWADTFLAWSNKEFDEFIEMYKDIKLPFGVRLELKLLLMKNLKNLKK